MKAVHRWWTIVWPFLVVVQISLVGVGAFHAAKVVDDNGSIAKKSFENWFDPHAGFGTLLVLLAIVYAIFSGATRERRLVKVGVITGVMFIVQMLLAWLGGGVPALGWLHPLNALLILGFTGRNAYEAWQEREALKTGEAAAAVTS
jgi:O-antigen ligase